MTLEGILIFLVKLILVVGLVGAFFWILWWAIHRFSLPEPFAKIAEIIIVIFAVVVALLILLWALGGAGAIGTAKLW